MGIGTSSTGHAPPRQEASVLVAQDATWEPRMTCELYNVPRLGMRVDLGLGHWE